MCRTLDQTDIPRVAPAELSRVFRALIDSGKGLVLLRGMSAVEARGLEAAIWSQLGGDIVERRAVLVRFHCLVQVFEGRRLRDLLLRRGFRVIAPAIQLAAGMRVSAQWGFSPHRFNLALQDLIVEIERQPRLETVPTLELAA
jgi:hypothetical protein